MQAKEPDRPGAHRNWGRTAAQVSLAAAILAWLIGQVFKEMPASGGLQQVKVYAEVVRIALYIGGASAALIALCAIRKFGSEGILAASCFGVFLNVGYLHVLSWANPEILHARQPPSRPGNALTKHSNAGRTLSPKEQPKAILDYEGLEFHRLQDAQERAEPVVVSNTPEAEAVRKAWLTTLISWKKLRAKVETAERLLTEADVFSQAIGSKEDFAHRRQLADEWFSAAANWEGELKVLLSGYASRLKEASVSEHQQHIELEALNLAAEIPRKIAIAHCEAQKEVAIQVKHAINALETEFSAWSVGEGRSGASFQYSPSWKDRCLKLSEAVEMLRTLRLELGLPPPSVRLPAAAAPLKDPDVLL